MAEHGLELGDFQELTRSCFTSSRGKNQIVLPVSYENKEHLKQNILLEMEGQFTYQQSSENTLLNIHLIDESCRSNCISFVFFWPWDFLYGYEWAGICVDESAPVPVFLITH